jgi:excisionase family DNA binding protein
MKTEQNAGQPPMQNGQNELPSGGAIPAPELPEPRHPEPLAYDIKQAAIALNISTKTVRRLLWRGKLTSCKALRKILIPREQIGAFLKATCDKPNFNT